MSKSTMADRAAAFVREIDRSEGAIAGTATSHLAAFAASEVARVERASVAIRKIFKQSCPKNDVDDVAYWRRFERALDVLDEATRPERPARAKAKPQPLPHIDDVLRERGLTHVGFVEKGGVVTDVNHKPACLHNSASRLHCGGTTRESVCVCVCHKAKPSLSSLARTAKKRGG